MSMCNSASEPPCNVASSSSAGRRRCSAKRFGRSINSSCSATRARRVSLSYKRASACTRRDTSRPTTHTRSRPFSVSDVTVISESISRPSRARIRHSSSSASPGEERSGNSSGNPM
jgi:hypothetical protein